MFCSELLFFVKKPIGNWSLDTFSPLKKFFSTSNLDIIVFANFVEKKQFALPATARNSLPQESGTSQNALINPPFCGEEKR
jgi:hypothetical protein